MNQNMDKYIEQISKDIPEDYVKESSNVFDKHQLKIAKDTLKMSDAGARIMGGMTKDEARAIIKKLTGRVVK